MGAPLIRHSGRNGVKHLFQAQEQSIPKLVDLNQFHE